MSSTILRVDETARRCGLSRSMLFALKAKGDFPQSVRLTSRTFGFVEAEVEAWIQKRVADSRGTPQSSDLVVGPGHSFIADEDVTESETEHDPTW
jgi:prophage regulatory protein